MSTSYAIRPVVLAVAEQVEERVTLRGEFGTGGSSWGTAIGVTLGDEAHMVRGRAIGETEGDELERRLLQRFDVEDY